MLRQQTANLYPLLEGQVMGFHLVVMGVPSIGLRSAGLVPVKLRLSV